jgi:hypothetical protein
MKKKFFRCLFQGYLIITPEAFFENSLQSVYFVLSHIETVLYGIFKMKGRRNGEGDRN